jgi:hypothetical protein
MDLLCAAEPSIKSENIPLKATAFSLYKVAITKTLE